MKEAIKVEHEKRASHLVALTMTNNRGTVYRAFVHKSNFARIGGPLPNRVSNVTTHVSIRTCSAPKWVQKTIEEQLPIVAIMLS